MSMHIEGPWLSTTGKKKGKKKFKSAEAAQKSRQLSEEWSNLKSKWGVVDTKKKKTNEYEVWTPPKQTHRGSESASIPSLDTGAVPCTKLPDKVYTGDSVLGVTIIHKSCLQPVFNKQEAVDAAKMRR